MIPIEHFLILAGFIFVVGLAVVITKKNAIMVLIGIELMLNSANLNFVVFSHYDHNIGGQLFSLFVILIAAAEVAVALAIVISGYRHYQTSDIDKINHIKP